MATGELKKIGQYEIIDKVARGGMATVYRAYQPNLDREVAIKVMSNQFADDPNFLERFRREARAIASLDHPNILAIYDFGQEGDMPYIVTQLVKGNFGDTNTLRDRLGQPLDLQTASRILTQVASALEYAHERGIVHRDIKPTNILMDSRGRAILSDFGIAKLMQEASTSLTAAGSGVGTPEYMSPEQGLGEPLDGRSDQYSLGVMLYEMITGVKPFQADTPLAVVMGHVSRPLPNPLQYNPRLTAQVVAVLQKALSKNKEDRYRTVTEFAEAFEQATHVPASQDDTLIRPAGAGSATIPTFTRPERPSPPPGNMPSVELTQPVTGPVTPPQGRGYDNYSPPPNDRGYVPLPSNPISPPPINRGYAPPPTGVYTPPPVSPTPPPPNEPKKRGLLVPLLIGGLVLALVLAGVLIALLAGGGSNATSTPVSSAATATATVGVTVTTAAPTTAPVVIPTTAVASVAPSVTAAPVLPSATPVLPSATAGPGLVIFGAGTTKRGDGVAVDPADATAEFVVGQEVFAFVNYDGGRPTIDKLDLVVIANGTPQPPKTLEVKEAKGFLFVSLGALGVGNYKLEIRYDGNLQSQQPEFKVVALPTATPVPQIPPTAIPPTRAPNPPTAVPPTQPPPPTAVPPTRPPLPPTPVPPTPCPPGRGC